MPFTMISHIPNDTARQMTSQYRQWSWQCVSTLPQLDPALQHECEGFFRRFRLRRCGEPSPSSPASSSRSGASLEPPACRCFGFDLTRW
jgi:hypothetical protein